MRAHTFFVRRKDLGEKDFRCNTPGCGHPANTMQARQRHAGLIRKPYEEKIA